MPVGGRQSCLPALPDRSGQRRDGVAVAAERGGGAGGPPRVIRKCGEQTERRRYRLLGCQTRADDLVNTSEAAIDIGRVGEVDRQADAARDIRRGDPIAPRRADPGRFQGRVDGSGELRTVDPGADRCGDRGRPGDRNTGVVSHHAGFDDQVYQGVNRLP